MSPPWLTKSQKKDVQELGKKIVNPQQVEIKGVKSQFETTPITEDDSDSREDSVLQQVETTQEDSISVRRPGREIRKPTRYAYILAYGFLVEDDDTPMNYREAT